MYPGSEALRMYTFPTWEVKMYFNIAIAEIPQLLFLYYKTVMLFETKTETKINTHNII